MKESKWRQRGMLICLAMLTIHSTVEAATTNNQDVVRALTMVAQGEYTEALNGFESLGQQTQHDLSDLSFYIAECHYRQGHLDQAEEILKQVLTTRYNTEEAYGRLVEIARKREDSEAVAKYRKAIEQLHEQIEREHKEISGRKVFTPDSSENEQETLARALKYYSSRQGYPQDIEAEDLILLGRYRDAVTVYEYVLYKKVPLSERFSSQVARKLYERIADIYNQQAEALKKKNRPEVEISQATAMERYYRNKALVVRSPQKAE